MAVEFNENIFQVIDAETDRQARLSANRIRNDARSNAPVITGNLKKLIQVEKIDDAVYNVASNAEYSASVNFGTKRSKKVTPFFTNAIEKELSR